MESKHDPDLSKVKGIYIYSGLYGDISAYQGEKVLIQVPVYDFSNELGFSNGGTNFNINITNFNIGTVKDVSLNKMNAFPDFDQYLLTFFLVPQKVGLHEVKDLTVSIRTKSNKLYTEKLGYAIFDVEPKQNIPFEIKEASGMSQGIDLSGPLDFQCTILNKSSNKIDLVSLEYHSPKVTSGKNGKIPLNGSLLPGKTISIEKDIKVSDLHGTFFFKPKLVYHMNGQTYAYPLNLTMLASTVPLDELKQRLKEKGMLH
jgi:hypothetical protein